MNTKHISLAFAAVAVLLAGCAKSPIEESGGNDEFGNTFGPADLELAYVGATETKVVINGTTFPENGEVGLFLFGDEEVTQPYGESGYTNVKYAYNSDKKKWTASPSMKVDSNPGYLFGYYPYDSEVADIKEIPVASSMNGDDVMYATKQTVTDKTAPQTSITMNHALARVSITIKNNGYTGDAKLSEISFSDAKIAETGTLNAIDGKITATQSDEVTLEVPDDCQSITKEGTTYECLLVPSEKEESKQTVELTLKIDGEYKTAILSNENGVIIAQNTKSSITITLSNSGIAVQAVSVEEWSVAEVGGHKVKVELSEEEDGIDDDVVTRLKVKENTVEILAYSLSGVRLECILTGEAEVSRDMDILDGSFTFTISDIDSDVTATIGYVERFDVTVTSNNPKWGSASFEGECYKGDIITFTATASDGNEFVEWQDADGNKLDWENPQDTTLTSDLTIEAVFKISGALPGKFTVGPGPDGETGTDDDKKVYFSQGNLQAKYSEKNKKYTWSFAAHQYDVIGHNEGNSTIPTSEHRLLENHDNAVVDLFCWSAKVYTITYGICADNTEQNYGTYYSGDFLDWGTTIGDKETWRTPTKEEWDYLISLNSYRLDVKVMGIDRCCVVYPQGYDTSKMVNSGDKETYNTEAAYNAATEDGVLFLPPTGYRETDKGEYFPAVKLTFYGYYWSSTLREELAPDPYYCEIQNDIFITNRCDKRNIGRAVRLVADCE